MPVHIVNEKMSDKSSLVSDLCCTMAGDTPRVGEKIEEGDDDGGKQHDAEVIR